MIRNREATCNFNLYVDCGEIKNCNKCGWNPKVAEIRIDKYGAEYLRNHCNEINSSDNVFYDDLRMEQQEQM